MDKLTLCSVETWCRKWCYYLYMFSHAGSMLLWIVMTLVMPWLFLCANSRYLLICWNESQTLHLTDSWVSLLPVGGFFCVFFPLFCFVRSTLCPILLYFLLVCNMFFFCFFLKLISRVWYLHCKCNNTFLLAISLMYSYLKLCNTEFKKYSPLSCG